MTVDGVVRGTINGTVTGILHATIEGEADLELLSSSAEEGGGDEA